MIAGLIFIGIGVVFSVAYVIGRFRDRRMVRNGVFLTVGIVSLVLGGLALLALVVPGLDFALFVVALLVPVAVVVLGLALVGNGVTMLRREGRSLGNLLSLVLGVAVLAVPVVVIVLLSVGAWTGRDTAGSVGAALGVFVALVCAYFASAFVSFATYSVIYARFRKTETPAAIIILGSGLIHGAVPPLLRSRLDRALELYWAETPEGRHPLLIPTGGQGADESRAEGEAMAEYLLQQGVPTQDVAAETMARNTRENLLLSAKVQEAAGRPGPVVVVTSDYHVLRAATLARTTGSGAEVIGSQTARYYVPSAFIREFVAIIVMHRRLNAVACIPFLVLTGYLLWHAATSS